MDITAKPEMPTLQPYADMINPTLSTESGEILDKIPEFFTSKLDLITEFFKHKETELRVLDTDKANVYYKRLYVTYGTLRNTTIDYSIVKRRKVATIPNIGVDIPTLTVNLLKANDIINANLKDIIQTANVNIAKLCSDSDYRGSSRPILLNKHHQQAVADLTAIKERIVSPTSVNTSKQIKDLIPSIPHLEVSINEALEYGARSNTVNYNKLSKETNTLAGYTETLYKQIKKDGGMNKARLVEVSAYIDTVANFISEVGNFYYLFNQSIIMIDDTIKTIIK